MEENILEMEGIVKRFPGHRVRGLLDGIPSAEHSHEPFAMAVADKVREIFESNGESFKQQ